MTRDHANGEHPDFDVRGHLSGRYIPPDAMPPRQESGGGGSGWGWILVIAALIIAGGLAVGWMTGVLG